MTGLEVDPALQAELMAACNTRAGRRAAEMFLKEAGVVKDGTTRIVVSNITLTYSRHGCR
jgi:hypothetical protein